MATRYKTITTSEIPTTAYEGQTFFVSNLNALITFLGTEKGWLFIDSNSMLHVNDVISPYFEPLGAVIEGPKENDKYFGKRLAISGNSRILAASVEKVDGSSPMIVVYQREASGYFRFIQTIGGDEANSYTGQDVAGNTSGSFPNYLKSYTWPTVTTPSASTEIDDDTEYRGLNYDSIECLKIDDGGTTIFAGNSRFVDSDGHERGVIVAYTLDPVEGVYGTKDYTQAFYGGWDSSANPSIDSSVSDSIRKKIKFGDKFQVRGDGTKNIVSLVVYEHHMNNYDSWTYDGHSQTHWAKIRIIKKHNLHPTSFGANDSYTKVFAPHSWSESSKDYTDDVILFSEDTMGRSYLSTSDSWNRTKVIKDFVAYTSKYRGEDRAWYNQPADTVPNSSYFWMDQDCLTLADTGTFCISHPEPAIQYNDMSMFYAHRPLQTDANAGFKSGTFYGDVSSGVISNAGGWNEGSDMFAKYVDVAGGFEFTVYETSSASTTGSENFTNAGNLALSVKITKTSDGKQTSYFTSGELGASTDNHLFRDLFIVNEREQYVLNQDDFVIQDVTYDGDGVINSIKIDWRPLVYTETSNYTMSGSRQYHYDWLGSQLSISKDGTKIIGWGTSSGGNTPNQFFPKSWQGIVSWANIIDDPMTSTSLMDVNSDQNIVVPHKAVDTISRGASYGDFFAGKDLPAAGKDTLSAKISYSGKILLPLIKALFLANTNQLSKFLNGTK